MIDIEPFSPRKWPRKPAATAALILEAIWIGLCIFCMALPASADQPTRAEASTVTAPAVCDSVAREINSGALSKAVIDLSRPGVRVDIFGDGRPVVVSEPGLGATSSPYGFQDQNGTPITLSTPDEDLIGKFGDPPTRLISIEGRAYILGGFVDDLPLYLSAVGSDHVESIICEFKTAFSPSLRQIVVPKTPMEALVHDARLMYSDPSVFALSHPGLTRVRALLQLHPYDLQLPNVDERSLGSPLVDAVALHRFDAVVFMLQSGVNPDWTASGNSTPLYFAMRDRLVDYQVALLNHGADPLDIMELSVSDGGGDLQLLDRLFSYGLDPGEWVYDAIFDMTSDTATPQSDLLDLRAQAASERHTYIEPALITRIMATPGAAVAAGKDELKLALSYRDAPDCPPRASTDVLKHCLPRELRESDNELDKVFYARVRTSTMEAKALERDELHWIRSRDQTCGVHPAYRSLGTRGWFAYVLSDSKRATCVVAMTRTQIAYLKGGTWLRTTTPGEL